MKLALPACAACSVQLPAAFSVTVLPLTVQMAVVVELKLTVRPDVAVALTENGAAPKVLPPGAAKLIVCPALPTANDWLTLAAAAYDVLPACEARTVQVPTPTRVTIAPATVHTDAVVVVNATARPEDALALTANGAVPYVLPPSAAKVMVWLASAAADAMGDIPTGVVVEKCGAAPTSVATASSRSARSEYAPCILRLARATLLP